MVQMEREREEALRRAGVSLIVRFTYDDVIERVPLVNKLLRAGIPQSSSSIHRRGEAVTVGSLERSSTCRR